MRLTLIRRPALGILTRGTEQITTPQEEKQKSKKWHEKVTQNMELTLRADGLVTRAKLKPEKVFSVQILKKKNLKSLRIASIDRISLLQHLIDLPQVSLHKMDEICKANHYSLKNKTKKLSKVSKFLEIFRRCWKTLHLWKTEK